MDSSQYREVITSREIKYSVYYKAGDSNKPTLVFLHGFPYTSYGWRHQVAHFQRLGYGIIAPDMLGYGNTDHPTNPALYAGTLLAQDILDILEIEDNTRVVIIGHDWGSKVVSRLANIDSDRILGFASLSIGYLPPNPTHTYQDFMAMTTQLAGRELFGYFAFFAEDGADEIIMKHFDSFMAGVMGFTHDQAKEHFAKTGALKAWLLSESPPPPIHSFVTQEEFDTQNEIIRKAGIKGPLHWYKAAVLPIDLEDSKKIPEEKYIIKKPFFFGADEKDAISIPEFGKATVEKFCTKPTIKSYNAGHWVMLETPNEVNRDLTEWIESISA